MNKSSLTLLALIPMMISSCKHDRNHPGYAYMPDMYYSEAYETYTPNPILSDSTTMEVPPAGTIPRGYIPYPYEGRSMAAQLAAGKEMENPIELTAEILLEGAEQYRIYCMICHGKEGDGQGHLYASGKFTAMPTSLIEEYVQGKPDGEIFHVITRGSVSGLMGAHGAQITPENRWKIVHYVRELAKK